ncbi:hypothetical protein IF1G_07417 [Cordyceps javanica]|uniref:Uncharacterized protein n=1 Tax=Cordyceps javanica TaxID=43265 RepID=A0A545UW50_9HYPO|nr:hypothetical protein IF1G_07417 [Cordyceps javanica]
MVLSRAKLSSRPARICMCQGGICNGHGGLQSEEQAKQASPENHVYRPNGRAVLESGCGDVCILLNVDLSVRRRSTAQQMRAQCRGRWLFSRIPTDYQ